MRVVADKLFKLFRQRKESYLFVDAAGSERTLESTLGRSKHAGFVVNIASLDDLDRELSPATTSVHLMQLTSSRPRFPFEIYASPLGFLTEDGKSSQVVSVCVGVGQ